MRRRAVPVESTLIIDSVADHLARSHAHYSLGNYDESIKAYTHGLTLDPNNANMKQALAQATAKAKQAEEQGSDDDDDAGVVPGRSAGGPGGMPDMSALAAMMGSMGGGAGGAGGPGGMPDLAGLMSNPAVMQMYVLFWRELG